MKTLEKPAKKRSRRRLSLKERMARAALLVDDSRIDGKRFKGEAPIIARLKAKGMIKGS